MSASEKTSEETTTKVANPDEDGEEIADDLSEISDEADDILGQQEVRIDSKFFFEKITNIRYFQEKQSDIEPVDDKKVVEEFEANATPVTKAKEANDIELEKIVDEESTPLQDHLSSAKSSEENDRSKDLCDDIDLDFEEISDGELEEEARMKGLGDALGVDWASLVEESKAMLREKLTKMETSAKQRWHPNQILLDVGISYKLAGSAFAQQTLIAAHENIKAEILQKEMRTQPTIKLEPSDDDAMNHLSVKIKTEETDEINEPKISNGIHNAGHVSITEPKLNLHPLPCAQVSSLSLAERQHRLIFNATGPYSRGLSIKRDIAMRRQLCNLATNETNVKITNTKSYPNYENIALKLFKKALEA